MTRFLQLFFSFQSVFRPTEGKDYISFYLLLGIWSFLIKTGIWIILFQLQKVCLTLETKTHKYHMRAIITRGFTEVGRAPLIHFQKIFFQKEFLYITISQIVQILYMNHYCIG